MEPDLDGRTVRGLQSRHEGLSETYREEFSDLGHLGLDHAVGTGSVPSSQQERPSNTWSVPTAFPLKKSTCVLNFGAVSNGCRA